MFNQLITIEKENNMTDKFIEIEYPGVMLKEDFLDDLGVKPGTFAKQIGVDRTAIKNIIDGKRAITADMSLRFSLYFGMSESFWMNIQKDYELRKAKRDRLAEFKKTVIPLSSTDARV